MRVVFGEFALDPDLRELRSAGGPIHLSPKAFQMLALLVEKRSRAVSKEDLYAHLWPDTYVEEANLKNLVVEVRAALGDDPRAPRFIKTLYGFGYAFIAGATEGGRAPAIAPDSWCLKHLSRIFRLAEGENVVGRDPTCSAVIDELDVSRFHARITIAGLTTTIEDLGSKNGTFVDGVRITTRTPLASGTEIRLGETPLTFHRREAPESTRSAW
jgi:DNA-binding winged helix-turn-helix (wHTH) protein